MDLSSNESGALKSDSKDGKIDENRYLSGPKFSKDAPVGLNADQRLAFALRDFLSPSSASVSDGEPSPSAQGQTLPFIDEHIDDDHTTQSDGEQPQFRETEDVLNNAACRLRRWRAVSRKLRRPRIINNLNTSDDKEGNISKMYNGGHTDLADRLRSLAAAGNMSASAGELLSLAPPPAAATAPPSPGCLLSPSLADQSSTEYFGSSPECCADSAGLETPNNIGTPAPPPGPRYKLAIEGSLRVCCFQHTRTVVDKILAAKFLRRWETHVLVLEDQNIISKTKVSTEGTVARWSKSVVKELYQHKNYTITKKKK
ncbi:unnamed protein product [Arctia plantaginis]|uniref:C-Maf-inducing protein PH domain-containing protein n=1 Tax=Arctia plantaginis TaxID=874455 RepID=A0A8S0ZZI3_ARCPL|nr:unnamed protein product [Arctia plantaginis]